MAKEKRAPRPGQKQRRRCGLAWLLLLLVWGGRWIWPLLWLPGWVVVLLGVWAVLEVVALLLGPQRWQ
ncbi:MAG: hypothetical protein VKK03_06030 [Synechococcus sp.]|nr:hypothetical protein [Synechococcus sp.]